MTDAPAISTRTHPTAPPAKVRRLTRASLVMPNVGLLCAGAALLLSLVGVMAISTTSPAYAARQLVFLLVGIVAAATVAVPHYTWIRRLSYPLLVLTLLLLVFLLIPVVPTSIVRPVNGARRWINLGLVDFQPSELAKVAFVLALANYLRLRKNYRTLPGLLPTFVLTCIPMGLIVIEPDLGTSLIFVPTLLAMLVAAGAKLKHIALIILLGLGSAPAIYPFLLPHQKTRIHAMLGQLRGDEGILQNSGFQADQAMMLIGAGQLSGVGKEHARDLIVYNALPEEHNDMIFAVVVTRWGLLGGIATMLGYLSFIVGGVLAAGYCRDAFGRLIAVGLVAVVFTQMLVNIGMTIGLLPITGMTLPFISYGGSSLVVNWLMTGMLVNVAMRPPRPLERESFEFAADEDE